MTKQPEHDLIVLSADLDTESALKGLFSRPRDLGTRRVNHSFVKYGHDAECRKNAHVFLRAQANRFRHALVVFDFEGCGREHKKNREEIETEVEGRLAANGWDDRAAVVVIAPEIENWIWVRSQETERIFGWSGKSPSLWEWLIHKKHLKPGEAKPNRPKEAFRDATRHSGVGHSASIFKESAESVNFAECRDPAFQKFLRVVQDWFPA